MTLDALSMTQAASSSRIFQEIANKAKTYDGLQFNYLVNANFFQNLKKTWTF